MSTKPVFEFKDTRPAEETCLILIGLNHKTADISLREKFALDEDSESDFRSKVLRLQAVQEVVVFSTCNRTELLAVVDTCQFEHVSRQLEVVLADFFRLNVVAFSSSLYSFRDSDAVRHLLRVAAGLDSMIVGEPQILGQLKTSFNRARLDGSSSSILNRLFHRAFATSKAVRTNTGIGRRAVSISYAAKELTAQIFGDLSQVNVMLLGAGDTGRLASSYIKKGGAKRFIVANRTLENAVTLAKELDGVATDLSNIDEMLPVCDVVIGASRGAGLISLEQARESMKLRSGKPQFFIDLGVPRNFDPAIDSISDSFLYGLTDLEQVVQQNLDSRELETEHADLIVDESVERFEHWLESRKADPYIKRLKEQASDITSQEVIKTIKRLRKAGYAASNGGELQMALETMAEAIASKLLHRPISQIKGSVPDSEVSAEKVVELFVEPK